MRRISVAVLMIVATSCASSPAAETVTEAVRTARGTTTTTAAPTDPANELFPDVVAAEVTETGDGLFSVAATLSSPYDTPEHFADAFRVLTTAGAELGVRVLTHDHADEQPFTRSLSGVEIPADVDSVVVEGRDLRNGWGGATVVVPVPGR